ncbi:MAG: HAD family hydrolase [Christensenellales bacterium]
MKVKAVIFDLDGTLLNTLTDLSASVNYTLERFGFPLRSEREVRSYLGNGIRALVEKSLPADKKDMTDECLKVFKDYYDIHKDDNTAPYDGIVDMLRSVKAAGLKTAIVSNKYDAAVQYLKDVTFSGLIDFAVGEGNGIAAKPAPDGVWLALKKLNAVKEESVYVGDSEVDLMTAENSGLKCVAVTWGFRDREELILRGAKNVIDAPDRLASLLISGRIA